MIIRLKRSLFGNTVLKLRDGKKITFTRFPKGDAKFSFAPSRNEVPDLPRLAPLPSRSPPMADNDPLLPECCRHTANVHFASRFPLSMGHDDLLEHLGRVAERWGVPGAFFDLLHVRTSSSPTLGISAQTGRLACQGCGSVVPYVFLGSRLCYFVWRVALLCGTFWKAESGKSFWKAESGESLVELTPAGGPWPTETVLEQLRLAHDLYFGDDAFLDARGMDELKTLVASMDGRISTLYQAIIDAGELFVLLHEIQHHLGDPDGTPRWGFDMQLPEDLPLSAERRRRWQIELTCDVNASVVLAGAVRARLQDDFGLDPDAARAQAWSIVAAGANAALGTIERIERLRYGPVEPAEAARKRAFASHPPSHYRKDAFSHVNYLMVTGKPVDHLWRGETTPEWRMVARAAGAQIRLMERLFDAYDRSPHAAPDRGMERTGEETWNEPPS